MEKKSWNKTRMFTFTTLTQIVLETLARAIKEKKERKGIMIEKDEVKLSVFTGDRLFCVKKPKHSTKKHLELINQLNKVASYRINIQKSDIFCILMMNS